MVTHEQFSQIRTHFAKLRSRLDHKALSEFLTNANRLAAEAPYLPHADAVMKQEWDALISEVKSAVNASKIQAGETADYRRFKANCEAGIFEQPGAAERNQAFADQQAAFHQDPAMYWKMRLSLGGLTKEQKSK